MRRQITSPTSRPAQSLKLQLIDLGAEVGEQLTLFSSDYDIHMYTLFMCSIGFLGTKAKQQPQKTYLKQVL